MMDTAGAGDRPGVPRHHPNEHVRGSFPIALDHNGVSAGTPLAASSSPAVLLTSVESAETHIPLLRRIRRPQTSSSLGEPPPTAAASVASPLR